MMGERSVPLVVEGDDRAMTEVIEYTFDEEAKKRVEKTADPEPGFFFTALPKMLFALAILSLVAGAALAVAAYLTPDEYYIRYSSFGVEERTTDMVGALVVGFLMFVMFLGCWYRQKTVRTALRSRERLCSQGRYLWYFWHIVGDLHYAPGYVPTDVHPTSVQVIAIDMASTSCTRTKDGAFWHFDGGIRWKRCERAGEVAGLQYTDMDPVQGYEIGDYFGVDLAALAEQAKAKVERGEWR